MEEVIATGIGTAVATATGFLAYLRAKKRQSNGTTTLVDTIGRLAGEIQDLKTTSEEPPTPLTALEERMESLERRMEQVHSDSLRYLQKAAAAEQRMNQREATQEDDEGGLTPEQAQALLDSEGQTAPSSPQRQLTLAEIEQLARG